MLDIHCRPKHGGGTRDIYDLRIRRMAKAEDLHSGQRIWREVTMNLEEAMEKRCIVTMLFFAAAVIEIHGKVWWYPTTARYKLG